MAAIFGGLALTNLKQELIPSIEFPALIVVSTYPGASPEVVSNDVSVPIETAIQGVPGLESSTATSTTNASIVQASFTYGTDLATAEQKMTQAINRIKSQLPEGVDPSVISASIDDFPVIQLAVTGYDDEATIQAQLEASVVPDLEDVDGVNAAQIVGGVGQRVTITPDQAALAAAGFSQQAISDALEQNGVLFPGGEVTENDETLTVQTGSKITSVDEIAALPLVPSTAEQFQGGATTIADVATVVEEADPVTTVSRVNGEPALTIAVTKLPSANTVDVSRGVLAILPDLEDSLDGAEFTVVFDQAPVHPGVDRHPGEGGPARPRLRRARHLRLPAVGALDARRRDLDPDEPAHHLHRPAGVRLLAEHPDARRDHDRDRTRRRRLDRRHREHQAALRRRCRQEGRDPARRPRGRLGHHGVDDRDRRGVPADRVRRRCHGRAVPSVRDDRHDRHDRVAVRRADHRAGAGVLVPEARQADPRRRGRRDRPRRPGRPAEPPAEVVPADPPLDAQALVGDARARRAGARRHDRRRARS